MIRCCSFAKNLLHKRWKKVGFSFNNKVTQTLKTNHADFDWIFFCAVLARFTITRFNRSQWKFLDHTWVNGKSAMSVLLSMGVSSESAWCKTTFQVYGSPEQLGWDNGINKIVILFNPVQTFEKSSWQGFPQWKTINSCIMSISFAQTMRIYRHRCR